MPKPTIVYTKELITTELLDDDKVKVAGFDVDGILRGKIISKYKFLSLLDTGFGFCSVIFGWDMHDRTYTKELLISNAENGYRDLLAKIDIQSYRRIPWEDKSPSTKKYVPFFLVSFHDPITQQPIAPDPRGVIKRAAEAAEERGWKAYAGAEYEFYCFDAKSQDVHTPGLPPHLTPGMFGYSLTRPFTAGGLQGDWYYEVWDACTKFGVPIEGWHTESGPGVYEAALQYGEVKEMADKAGLFKYAVKCLGSKYGIMPCFMAKPKEGLPGNSGHLHVSIVDAESGKNLFARSEKDENAPFTDAEYLSDLGRHFLAGVLKALPDIMPCLAPTINSYKRLVENFWAPVTVSWGHEHRSASIRLICPPSCPAAATRFEIRTPGADCNPHFALGAVLAAGLKGIEDKMELTLPPLRKGQETGGERLAADLKSATEKFMSKDSWARVLLGDDFVDHFGGTRREEVRRWEEAVTDWEFKRYTETV